MLQSCFICLLLALLLWTPSIIAVQVTSIRLINGPNISTRVGRVEILVGQTWGSICDDGWNTNDAIVACRMLGFTNGGTAVTDTRYGTGSFLFLMDDTVCTGDESSLSECLSSQISDCKNSTDTEASVECNPNLGPGQSTQTPVPPTTVTPNVISGNCQTNPTVRLQGKQNVNGMGYVQAQMPNGTWGYVCDDGWNFAAAKIVCAQLCFPTNYTAKPGIPAENTPQITNPIVVLDDLNCAGTEATLQDCPHAPWGVSNCLATQGELAGIQCVAAPYLPPPAPVPVLICGQGKMIAQFSRTLDTKLEEKHLSVFSQPNCADATKNTSTEYVSIIIPVDKCGTTVSRNGTHIIYYNEIKYDSTSQEGAITRVNTYRVEVTCILPVNVEVTQRVEPLTQAVTQSAVGHFDVRLTIFRNDSFTVPVTENPVQIPLGEYLNMVVSMEEYDPNLKLVVTDCIASPTGDLLGNVRKVLFADKCSQEDSLTFYPLSNFRFGFRFKPFKFVGYDILYVHCDAIICLAASVTQECDQTCANSKPNGTTPASSGRKRRNAGIYSSSVVSPAIIIYVPSATGSRGGSSSGKGGNDDTNGVIILDHATITNLSTQQTATPVVQHLDTQPLPQSSIQGIVTVTKYKEEITTLQVEQERSTVSQQTDELQNASQQQKKPESASLSGNGSHRCSQCSVIYFVLLVSIWYMLKLSGLPR